MYSIIGSLFGRAAFAALVGGVLAASFPAEAGTTPAGAQQITTNDVADGWDGSNLVNVDGQVLYHEDLKDIYWYDGVTSTPVQTYDAGVPALDLVAGFVFALGSGSSPGQVVGAWRRGANFAWVWTSDQTPVQIDTYAANLLDPTQPTNPEALAIADGCVFMVMQANDDGTVVRRVFQIDTQTGQPRPVSGSASVFGAGRVVTSQCRAAWVYDPNDNDTGGTLPLELQYFDGTTTVTLDHGLSGYTDFDLSGDQLVYLKRVDGFLQVLVLDVSDPSAPPQVLSTSSWPKVNPQTDGRHVAWAERVSTDTLPALHRIMLNGGIDLTPRATEWPAREGYFAFTLSRGQLIWERDDDIFLLSDNEVIVTDNDPAANAKAPQLSGGTIAFVGEPAGETDDEVFVCVGPPPVFGPSLPPPMMVRADLGPGRIILDWDRVLGATSYNVYYAETSGIAPDNYQSLPGGTRLTSTEDSVIVESLDPTKDYFFVVTSANDSEESIASGEAAAEGFLVETTLDLLDANPGDGVCSSSTGQCSLRAAIQEANAANSGLSVAVPAGTYLLTQNNQKATTKDLNLLGHMTIVGAGRDDTIIDGNQFERVIHASPVDTGTVTLTDLTVRNGRWYGILNEGALRLERVAVVDSGPFDQAGGIDQSGISLEIIDSMIARNIAGSHGGGIRTRAGHTLISGSLVSNNIAGIGGGAIYVFPSSLSVVVRGSEISNNGDLGQFNGGAISNETSEVYIHDSALTDNYTTGCGGAVYVSSGDLHMVNVTVSGNRSETGGGAICSSGSLASPSSINLGNVTFYDNSDTSASGESLNLSAFSTAYIRNSIVASPAGPTALNCAGATLPVSLGFNLESGDSCGFGADDLINTDPLLGPLDDNGGPTSNHAPASSSPAIDGGNPVGCTSHFGSTIPADQRGAVRPFDGDGDGTPRCDIGAFEDLGDCTDSDGDGFAGGLDPRCMVGESVDCDDGNGAVFPNAVQVCDGLNNDCHAPGWPELSGTNEVDGDGDGLSECAGDCLDSDGTVTGTPGEVEGLLFSGETSFDWAVPSDPGGSTSALSYDLHRSGSAADMSLDGTCLGSMQGAQIGNDPGNPADGAAFYYLVRARNACPDGVGSWGSVSAGGERAANVCP